MDDHHGPTPAPRAATSMQHSSLEICLSGSPDTCCYRSSKIVAQVAANIRDDPAESEIYPGQQCNRLGPFVVVVVVVVVVVL